ncbi:MAG: NAD-binding protein, partial [Sinobacterium sp.]|nr:NAD-binding protein [Sinobacterium sp.]
MENSLKNTSIALIGCGDLGNRTAALLLEQQADVAGFRRQPQHIIEGVNATALDVNDKRSLDCLHQQHFDYVVISLTPDISAKIKD